MKRRNLLKILRRSATNAYYNGPVSDHFDGSHFFNPGGNSPRGFRDLLRWQFTEPSARWPKRFDSPHSAKPAAKLDGPELRLTYIGHASFLLQTAGLNILLDPVWSQRASPVPFAGPKRVNPPGVAFDDLPRIDAVLLSHNHYDHMDLATIGRLWRRDRPAIVTPLGNDTIIRRHDAAIAVQTLDWHQAAEFPGGVIVHAEPTQHWSARGTSDRMHALWASFVIETPSAKAYFVGDSGLGDGGTFKQVARRHPGIALALLPIGAYEPRWFMQHQHMNPDDAVQALELCGAKQAIAHHWGTFKLTNEGIEQPLADLAAALAARGVAPDRFQTLRPGQARDFSAQALMDPAK